MPTLCDSDAKSLFLNDWPAYMFDLWPGAWFRACPRVPREEGIEISPWICTPGATKTRTIPDAMYLRFNVAKIGKVSSVYVDAICVEVCSTLANLQDKRARYMPTTCSKVVLVGRSWLINRIVEKSSKSRWQMIDEHAKKEDKDNVVFGDAPTDRGKSEFPIRLLRVLYAIDEGPQFGFQKWKSNHVPSGYEYFCTHDVLKNNTNPKLGNFGRFLKQMGTQSQFFFDVGGTKA